MRRAILAIGVLFVAQGAWAWPMPAGERERAWESQRYAPAHIQAEIVATPVEGFAFNPWTPCAADVVVKVVFKGQELFPVGRRFRLKFPWGNGWYLLDDKPQSPRSAHDVVCNLAKGMKLEVFLGHGGFAVGSALGFGLYKIGSFTDHPIVNPEQRPSWFQKDALLAGPAARDWNKTVDQSSWADPVPLAFPSKDATITYRSSAAPGKVYTASFSAEAERSMVTRPAGWFSSSERSVIDPEVSLQTVFDDSRHTYVLIPYNDIVFARFWWPGLRPTVVGRDVIAGLPCTYYKLEAGGSSPPAHPAIVCVTDDGLRLKRVQDGITLTALSVKYGPVSQDESLIPEGYVRVRGSEDRKAGRRPIWID